MIWCEPVLNRKATCNIWLRAEVPGTWWDLASLTIGTSAGQGFGKHRLSTGLGTKVSLCISSLRLHTSSVKQGTIISSVLFNRWGNRQRHVSELACGHTARIKIPTQSQAPEFTFLTRYSAQWLPTHHTMKQSRLLIYTLTYLGQANAVPTQGRHYNLTVF